MGTRKKGKERRSLEGLSGGAKRSRRRMIRRRIVIMQKIAIAVLVLAAVGGGFAVIWNLPGLKLDRELKAGEEYLQEASYDEAITYYENALKIDSTSVKAYRYMANAYFDMEDSVQAKQVLFEGWQNTQDESLLQYYLVAILNEAVAEINGNSCSLDTVEKILTVLEQDVDNEDAAELMYTAYERIISRLEEENNTVIFYDESVGTESCSFDSYEQIMNKLFSIYQKNPAEEIKNIISRYAIIDIPELRISRHHLEAYKNILEEAAPLDEEGNRNSLLLCLDKEADVQKIFADVFVEFDEGNYEAAKNFIVSDIYTGMRDEFINGTMEYWNGTTYIPVSRETVILKQTDGAWTFEYPSFKDNEKTAGIITVWGNKMTDDGIQRSCISYEPAKGSDSYLPHTEYVVSYMYSNVQKKNAFEAEMNYHLETRTWTEDGMTTVMIGDWGGPYQWEKTY